MSNVESKVWVRLLRGAPVVAVMVGACSAGPADETPARDVNQAAHMDAPGETSSFILLQMFSILLVINPVFPAKRNDRSTILSIEG